MTTPMAIGRARSRYRLTTNEKIDVCRGLFAFLVVIAHSLEVTFSMLPDQHAQLGPLASLFYLAAGTGIYWVMGFFVISGYCIHLSVQRMCEAGTFPLGNYLIARLTRLLPLYYLALLFAVAAEWWIAPVRPPNWPNGLNYQVLACQVLLIQNLTQTYGSFSSSWSITNEAFYYVFYGLLVVGAMRWRRRPAPLGLAACLAIGMTMYLVYKTVLRSPAVGGTALLFGLGTHWFLGALVAAHRDGVSRDPRLQRMARMWPLVLAASVGVKCLDRKGFEFVLMLSGAAFALMLVRFLGKDREQAAQIPGEARHPLMRSVITGLGLASYPTYLFHGPIIMMVGSVLSRMGLVLDWRWTAATLASFGIACGIAGGYLLEWPIMSCRAALLRRLSAPAGSRRVGRPLQLPIPATR